MHIKIMVSKTSNKIEEVQSVFSDRFRRATLENWAANVDTDPNKVKRLAQIAFIFVFVFGGVWSCTAPLGGAIVISGRVMAEGKNRIVQHLEGGILKELYVREGDKVESGQIVAKLETIQIGAQLSGAELQKAIMQITLARHRSELQDMDRVVFPNHLDPALANHPRVVETLESQREEFEAQYNYRKAGREIIDAKIRGQEGDIEGLREVLKAMTRQLELYEVELTDYRNLLEKGAIDRTRVFATERQVVEHQARIARTKLDIKAAENNIETLKNEKRQNRLKFLKSAAENVVQSQQEITKLEASIERLRDMDRRSEIISNDNGTIFRIAKQTIGGVLKGGEALMEIYPDEDRLTVEGMLEVRYIDKVFVGQEASIVFPANRAKANVEFPATISFLSPDSVTTENNPLGYYIIRVTAEKPEEISELIPGNSAQLFIKTESQTFIDVLAGPFKRLSNTAFTE